MRLHRNNRQKTKVFQIIFDTLHDGFLKKEINVKELFLGGKSRFWLLGSSSFWEFLMDPRIRSETNRNRGTTIRSDPKRIRGTRTRSETNRTLV